MNPNTKRFYRYFTYIEPIIKLPFIKTYGTIILTLITLIIFIIFAIKPTIETILVLQKKSDNAKIVLEKINKKSETLSVARKNYQNLNPNIKLSIQKAVPVNAKLETIISSLEDIAKIHQATISALQFQPTILGKESLTGKTEEINFTYNAEGTYDNLIKMLQDFRKSQRLLFIKSLTINKVEGKSTILMSITGKGYYIK